MRPKRKTFKEKVKVAPLAAAAHPSHIDQNQRKKRYEHRPATTPIKSLAMIAINADHRPHKDRD